MNVWIITTGSSDVQLTTNKHWNELCDKARNQLDTQKKIDLDESVVKPRGSDSPIKRFLAKARAMGIVYGKAIAEKAEYYNELDFPLLNSFSTLLQEKKIVFSKIIVLVTDQANLFKRSEKNQLYCPHWQDTCTLETILKQYFQNFPHKVEGIEPEFLILQPDTEKSDADSSRISGLDDWNNVLKLAQKEFANFNDIPEGATIYVSHQASTPAISSAVQFVSLARFGERVKFLVSNEYERKPLDPIESSEYLKEIQREKAKKLLDRHDYSGVKALLSSSLNDEIEDLLDAAIQWNFAKFDDFAKAMEEAAEKYSKENEWWRTVDEAVKARSNEWWWTAYEAAYLGVVRLKQGNTVEAMFHSFRAVEGLLDKWVDEYDKSQKQGKKITKQGKKIKLSNKIVAPWDKQKTTDKVNSYGQGLYFALEFVKGSFDKFKDTELDIWTFGNSVFDERNKLFHKLGGLKDKEDVFKRWEIFKIDEQEDLDKLEQRWKDRVLKCLNFIAEPKPHPTSLEEASLMFNVHQELVNAIASYQP